MTGEVITVIGTLIPPTRRIDPWTVSVHCPYCHHTHIHGAGMNGDIGDGHRVADCTGGKANPGYYVKVQR